MFWWHVLVACSGGMFWNMFWRPVWENDTIRSGDMFGYWHFWFKTELFYGIIITVLYDNFIYAKIRKI